MKLDLKSPPDSDDYYLGIALAARRKANCTSNRVGAVIVKNKRVISTGYNEHAAEAPGSNHSAEIVRAWGKILSPLDNASRSPLRC